MRNTAPCCLLFISIYLSPFVSCCLVSAIVPPCCIASYSIVPYNYLGIIIPPHRRLFVVEDYIMVCVCVCRLTFQIGCDTVGSGRDGQPG